MVKLQQILHSDHVASGATLSVVTTLIVQVSGNEDCSQEALNTCQATPAAPHGLLATKL